LVTFLTTPHLLHTLGRPAFGVWVLLQTVVVIAATSDFGLTSSLGRFLAVRRGQQDDAAATRLMVTALCGIAIVAGLLDIVVVLAGPHIVPHLGLTTAEQAAVHDVIGPLCLLIPAAMLSGLGVAAGLAESRFQLVAGVVAGRCAAYLVLVLTTIHAVGDLPRLTFLAAAQAGVVALALNVAALVRIERSSVGLLQPQERRELWRYARRLQLVSLAVLINTELDAVVIALFLPVRTVGTYGIGAAAAAGARALPLYAIPPIRTTLAGIFGRDGRAATVAEFTLRHRQWLVLTIPYGLVTAVSMPFCVMAWLGRDYRNAGLVATILVIGFAVNLSAAVASILVQALGLAELESRYSLLSIIVNLTLTIPLAIGLGLYGVVTATTLGAVGATLYFYALVGKAVPEARGHLAPSGRIWPAVLTAAVVLAAQAGLEQVGLGSGLAWLTPALAIALAGLLACIAMSNDARIAMKGLLRR
jgi:O-antigen/teichoic acid export membrane protein